jgi:hypothetical protein
MIFLNDISVKNLIAGKMASDLPEFYKLKKVVENNIWHNESVFNHTINILSLYEDALSNNTDKDFLSELLKNILCDNIDGISKIDLFKLVILFHDISKIDTIVFDESYLTHCPGHEEAGYLKTKFILNRFAMSDCCKDYILKIIKYHGIPHVILDNIKGAEFLLNERSKNFLNIYPDLLLFCLLDTMGSHLRITNSENYNNRLVLYKKILINLNNFLV